MVNQVDAYLIYLEALGTASGTAAAYTEYLEVLGRVGSPASVSEIYLEALCKILVPAPYVPDDAIPWTIPPNWETGVTERLKWRTDVLQSETGVEQRKAIRLTPRRDIEARYLIYRNTRRLYENLMAGPGASVFRVPCWWEKSALGVPANTGDTFLTLQGAYLEIQNGDTIMLYRDAWTYEYLIVQKLDANGIELQNTVVNPWPAGTAVYLTRRCVLTGDQKASRRTDDVADVILTFETREPNPWPALTPTTMFAGMPLLLLREDFREDTTQEYSRMLAIFDNDTGAPLQRDLALQAFRHTQVVFTALNREQAMILRGTLYFMAGRLNFFYWPTNNADVLLAQDIGPTDTTITVYGQDYTEYGGASNVGRNVLMFYFGQGVLPILVTVTGSTTSGSNEVLTLAGPTGVAVSAAAVQRACFVQLYRQDADEIELQHMTDSAGATVLKTTFISSQNNRTATDYELPPGQGYTGDNQGL